MIDLNHIADECGKTALKRGQIREGYFHHMEVVPAIRRELLEYTQAKENNPSEHIPEYTESEEEIADILIICLTELSRRNVNVEEIITKKLEFNKIRKP